MSAGDGSEYSKCRVFASLPQTKRGFPTVLGTSPNGQKIIYCNGNSVFIVDVENITDVDIYTEHSVPTTVAKMSPSGFYIASGDSAGNVRIWDTTQSTHILKATYQVFSGSVRDIAWNDDSKRIAAVGEGRERFGHVFLFDTGTSNGNLSGQSRPMSSIDFRPARPYRLISGSEDNTVAIFEGPPFKFKTTFHEHTRFVHVTKYNPDGSLFASASADGKVVLFEGVEGAKVAELVDPSVKGEAAHTGSVFGLAWSPCGKKIATASADKTVKIWGVDDKTLEKTIHFGDAVEDQQVGIVWSSKALVSVSLTGFLSFFDPSAGEVTRVLHGHNKGITTLALSECKQWLFTSDFEGHINSPRSTSVKLPSQPLDLASAQEGGLTIVACYKNVLVFKDEQLSTDLSVSFSPSCVALSGNKVAVGGQDSKVHIFTLSGTKLSEEKTLPHSSPITKVAFSPNGEYLVATDSGRKVVPYSVNDGYKTIAEKEWTFHTAKVNCVAWSSDNRHIATGGLDTNVIVWDLQRSGEHPIIIRGVAIVLTVMDTPAT
ncbi:WD domain, G-beta repeat protein [Ancylostoma duodenale]|uniref:WD domain, G-beta repeat protein n=1 Tax=Ancylostoma duodenale TaxID=51022 RepID=A0A0C2GZI0_9BILA|nr:WD domain, G-beta repeat protein [Ancylostoma duodenale]